MALVNAREAAFEGEATVELGRARALWATIRRKPLGAVSAALIAVLVLTAIFADVLAPYDPLAAQPEIRLAAPSWEHPFGTDDIGRDVLSRVVHGTRISLWVGFAICLDRGSVYACSSISTAPFIGGGGHDRGRGRQGLRAVLEWEPPYEPCRALIYEAVI